MRYRPLGRSDLETSVIGLGTMSWPGCHFGVQGDPSDAAGYAVARETVRVALESGINLFDAAEGYGRGVAETWLGRALAELGAREGAIVVTKVGPLFGGEQVDGRGCNLSKEHILTRCDESLRRLGVETIDLYLAHWPDDLTPIGETIEAAEELRRQGKIRWFGVSNFPSDQLGVALRHGSVVVNELPYSLADRGIDADRLPFCRKNDVGILAYSPLGKGLLGGRYDAAHLPPPEDYRHTRPHFSAEKLPRNLALAERLREIASKVDSTPAAVALSWVIEQPGITVALPGAKSVEQVGANAAAADLVLPEDVLAELDEMSRVG
jgi:aryl-alcohol dehydrogenase-like predicted oxidoreductase